MTKLTVEDRMCVVELATGLELAGDSSLYPHGFRFPDGKVIWEAANGGRGKLIRIQRIEPGDGTKVVMRTRYVPDNTLFEVVPEFDFADFVFAEPPP
jgi:hypothetical protein